MKTWQAWLAIGVFGALGSLVRWQVSAHLNSGPIPWGTITVNLVGSFLFGLVYNLSERSVTSSEIRLLLLTGFMGAFTTFSTFAFDSVQMWRNAPWRDLLVYLAFQLAGGVAAMMLGLKMGSL